LSSFLRPNRVIGLRFISDVSQFSAQETVRIRSRFCN